MVLCVSKMGLMPKRLKINKLVKNPIVDKNTSEGKTKGAVIPKRMSLANFKISKILEFYRELRKTLRYYRQLNVINTAVRLILLYNIIAETARGWLANRCYDAVTLCQTLSCLRKT